MSWAGFIPKNGHRRFWNWILLSTFLLSALLGLFLALKITYRWNIPAASSLLSWHVEAGIAMTFVSLIHLSWHLRYYLGKRDEGKARSQGEVIQSGYGEERVPAALLLMVTGFVSSSVQFIMLREALIMGGGTEIISGIYLWLWLIFAAAGSMSGRNRIRVRPGTLMTAVMILTILSPLLFVILNRVMLSPGETPAFITALVILGVSISPLTFVTSFAFIRLTQERAINEGRVPGTSFGIETIGSVVAGLLTTIATGTGISNYRLLIFVFLISALALSFILAMPRGRRTVIRVLAPVLLVLALWFSPDAAIRGLMMRGVVIGKSTDTPYGNITTGSYGGEETVFYDMRPLFYSGDVVRNEEDINYALLHRNDNDTVLLISGGLERHLAQLKKFGVKELDYVELDPYVIDIEGIGDTTIEGIAISVINTDPVLYIRRGTKKYNAIIQLLPPPSTLSVNRYYTMEYFEMIRQRLTPGGIFLCTPAPWFNYSPETYVKGVSPIYNALDKVFNNVAFIPGSSLYMLGSDLPVSVTPAAAVEKRIIENEYVNSNYLDDNEISRKSELIAGAMDANARANSSLMPASTVYSGLLSLRFSEMHNSLIAIVILMSLVSFVWLRRGSVVMFAASSGVTGFAMITMFILQTAAGSIYQLSALVITLILSGLAIGAAHNSFNRRVSPLILTLLLSLLCIITGISGPLLTQATPVVTITVISLLLTGGGYITGTLFGLLTSAPGVETGDIYAADLAGAALGYLITATLLVPLTGLVVASFLLAAFILFTGILVPALFKH